MIRKTSGHRKPRPWSTELLAFPNPGFQVAHRCCDRGRLLVLGALLEREHLGDRQELGVAAVQETAQLLAAHSRRYREARLEQVLNLQQADPQFVRPFLNLSNT